MKHQTIASLRVEKLVHGVQTSDGAGVKLTRVLTQDLQRRLDPFLMLDAFRNDNPDDYIGGFPDHPHRGFETVTYMLAGQMRHRDSAGHEGLLGPGGVQWMTAGSGLIHSELPEQTDGLMEGFQLWLNLPANNKMVQPGYRDIAASDIPEYTTDTKVRVRVIAGESHGVTGAVQRPVTEPLFLDIHMPTGTTHVEMIDPAMNAFVYVYRGQIRVGEQIVSNQQMAVLAQGDHAEVRLASQKDCRLLLIAGRPLNEPIVQYGPFVMNSQQQIMEAMTDYRNGRFLNVKVDNQS